MRQEDSFWSGGDDDEGDGPLHANFKLSGDGEELGLFNTLAAGNTDIDSLTFGSQSDDISYGRYPDGVDNWITFSIPTPGSTNAAGLNSPPTISETTHEPASPTSHDNVTVTSLITDDGEIVTAELHADTGDGYFVLTMYDDGGHGDGAADDNVYGAIIPAVTGGE